MKRIKKLIIALLCFVIFTENIYVNTLAEDISNKERSQDNALIYLTDGEGNEGLGNGSKKNPYRNIRTALKNVEEGGTIKILGSAKYWYYKEYESTMLPLPLIIDKNITIEGEVGGEVFATRAPIQLGKNVAFKNITMEFWASNELMPGVPDPGLPQTPIDEGTIFRSGRTIYLAGNELTLDNVDTRINTASFHRDYRPYISGGTFLSVGNQGNKSVLNVINANEGTQFAGIYAGDYWKESNFSVDINIDGKIDDNTIHTGGIMLPFHGDVTVKIDNKIRSVLIDRKNHVGNIDVTVKSNGVLSNSDFSGVRNLTLESNSKVGILKDSIFEVDNLTIEKNASIDFTKCESNIIVNKDFIGDIENNNKENSGGTIYLTSEQVVDIKGEVKGNTLLNSDRKFNILDLRENHTYIKANKKSSGDFKIYPKNYQKSFKLKKEESNLYTTWTVIEKDNTFKDFNWAYNGNENIKEVFAGDCYIYDINFINQDDEEYIPNEDELNKIRVTLKKPDGTILNLDNCFDSDLEFMLTGTGIYIFFETDGFVGEIVLTVTYDNSKSIIKRINIGDMTELPEESTIIQAGDFLFDKEDRFIISYIGDDEIVTIPSQIEGIKVEGIDNKFINGKNGGFIDNKNIKKIIFENGIRYIGTKSNTVTDGVFQGCSNLEKVVLPETLEYIGKSAFSKCINLKDINIPNSVTEIGESAFSYCESIENIELSDNLKMLGNSTFAYSINLETIILSKNTSFKYTDIDGSIVDSQNVFEGCINLININIYYVPSDDEFKRLEKQLLNQNINSNTMINRIENEDLNKDNKIDFKDLEIILEKFNITSDDKSYNRHYDFNKDGIIDLYDVVKITKNIKM